MVDEASCQDTIHDSNDLNSRGRINAIRPWGYGFCIRGHFYPEGDTGQCLRFVLEDAK